MRYFANPSTPAVREAMTAGVIGCIDTPAQGNHRPPGAVWCADNGCFSDRWDERRWWTWLRRHAGAAGSCAFAVAPDVVADAMATAALADEWLGRIRALGYPAAYVAQDGLENLDVPWGDFDVLFIGGTTEWKLGVHARTLVRQARELGKPVHMGRCNSYRRLAYAEAIGCTSADGTFIAFAPDENLPRVARWLEKLAGDRLQGTLDVSIHAR